MKYSLVSGIIPGASSGNIMSLCMEEHILACHVGHPQASYEDESCLLKLGVSTGKGTISTLVVITSRLPKAHSDPVFLRC